MSRLNLRYGRGYFLFSARDVTFLAGAFAFPARGADFLAGAFAAVRDAPPRAADAVDAVFEGAGFALAEARRGSGTGARCTMVKRV